MATRSLARATFLSDVIIGAVEGGTGYWAQVSGYHWSDDDPSATEVIFHDMEDGTEYPMDIDKVASAIGKLRAGGVQVNATTLASILEGDKENDGGMIDAGDADIIVQVACFGEIVYG